jgi:hypothetical protein|tara:strand:+ start:877 stop:1776 length:900 start_codon:yes stop_codon:yes gene_type:complete
MATILNSNFIAGETAQVAGTNTKFTDVQTQTGQLNDENVRSEAVDLWQLDGTSSMVKASGRETSVATSFTHNYVSKTNSGTAPYVIQQDNGSGAAQDLVLDLGSLLTVNNYDVVRVYWNIEVIDQGRTADETYTSGNYTGPSQTFWGVWLQWSTNGSAWSNVPNQGDFANTTIGVTTTEMLPIPANASTARAFMPIPHVLFYVDRSTGTQNVLYDYGTTGADNYTTGSAWFYRPTAGSAQYRYFRLVLGGIFQSMNDGASPPVSHIADVGGIFAPGGGAAQADITLRRVYLCAVHTRGS